MSREQTHRDAVLLVSTPWRLSNWPSLALGALKAYLRQRGVTVIANHLHLYVACQLGLQRYDRLARGWDLGTAIYSSLLAPDEADRLLGHAARVLRASGDADLAEWAEGSAVADVQRATLAGLERLAPARYGLIGLSVGALQLTASLYVARELRRLYPATPIVLGGSALVEGVARRILEACPYVDVVVDGEGERPLLALCQLPDSGYTNQLAEIPNLWYRRPDGTIARTATRVLDTLGELPAPDLAEFFDDASELGHPSAPLVLPFEVSRGCAWEHRKGDGQLHGCTFCGLYRNSPDYRERSAAPVLEQIRACSQRYGVLNLSLVDAYLPSRQRLQLLDGLASAGEDYTLFCELRCDLDDETAQLLAGAGARRVQLGVESFSTATLSRLHKGTQLIDNLDSIKLCHEYGIPYQYNLLVDVPGVPAEEVRTAAAVMPLLHGFEPPQLAVFYLDRGSRMYRAPAQHGIDPTSIDAREPADLPSFLGAAASLVVSYAPLPGHATADDWSLIQRGLERWREARAAAARRGVTDLLTYRDGGTFVRIDDHRSDEPRVLVLEGILRRVLLACERRTSRNRLARELADVPAGELDSALDMLADVRLLIRDHSQLLALPVRARLPAGIPRRLCRTIVRETAT
jgi:ribosomal peptide maturation radical SAM protein 1